MVVKFLLLVAPFMIILKMSLVRNVVDLLMESRFAVVHVPSANVVVSNNKSTPAEVKVCDKGRLLERFRKAREASTSKQISSMSDSDESEVEEVCMPDLIPGGGFLDGLEDDLERYDGYEAWLYDLSEQEQAFCGDRHFHVQARLKVKMRPKPSPIVEDCRCHSPRKLERPWDMMKTFDDNIPHREFDNFQMTDALSHAGLESSKSQEKSRRCSQLSHTGADLANFVLGYALKVVNQQEVNNASIYMAPKNDVKGFEYGSFMLHMAGDQ
ncbi:hypothetical protein Tco_0615573 [Tanacetum coccineum]